MSAAIRDQRLTWAALALAVLANLLAINMPLMEGDATLYANLAAAMVKSGDYIGLYARGQDWLDKPHLPFWIAAASFRLFGVSSWAYRLPAFLAIVGTAYYTFRLGSRYYGRTIGLWAAIILLTAEHTILSSADVRAEPFVTLFVIATTWYLIRVAEDDRWFSAAIAGALFAAAAMMSKGLFTLIPAGGALAGHWVLRGRPPIAWRRWALVAVVAGIGIMPELAALYDQFDRHPEKIVFGATGVSGIRFFLWDSQFGRFLGNGPIRQQDASPTFFLHTILWVFLPWSFALILAVVRRVRLLRTGQAASTEWYTLSGATLMFVVFSASRFQLPHYLNIIFPFLAILTAGEVQARVSLPGFRLLGRVQIGLLITMLGLGVAIGVLVRPEDGGAAALIALVVVAAMPVAWRAAADNGVKVLVLSVLGAVAVNLYFERGIYPTLLRYDGGLQAARYVNDRYPDATVIVLGEQQRTSFEFALRRSPQYMNRLEDTSGVVTRPYLLLSRPPRNQPPDPRTVASFDHFGIAMPTLPFLNHRTRPRTLSRLDLLLITAAASNTPTTR